MESKNGKREDAINRATAYFGNGFHCAEAVASAVLEVFGMDPKEAAAHATAFGGGFGRSFGEACGALSGGMIAIGHIHGRKQPGGDWDLPAALGAMLREKFLAGYGTAHCKTLRDRFGDENQDAECGKIVELMAGSLVDLLVKGPEEVDACAGQCCSSAA